MVASLEEARFIIGTMCEAHQEALRRRDEEITGLRLVLAQGMDGRRQYDRSVDDLALAGDSIRHIRFMAAGWKRLAKLVISEGQARLRIKNQRITALNLAQNVTPDGEK